MSADMHLSAGLALALRRMVHAISLVVRLALTLSSMNCGSPIRSKISHQTGREIHGQTRRRRSGAGWIKSVGSVSSPEKCIIVDYWDISLFNRGRKPTLWIKRKAADLDAIRQVFRFPPGS